MSGPRDKGARTRADAGGAALRRAAVRVLQAVLDQGQSLDRALAQVEGLSAADRGMLAEICYGVLRWQRLLGTVIDGALSKPLRSRDRDLNYLLQVALYQLAFMRVPDYAAVDSAVAAARSRKRPWAGGLVNGVLRGLLRRRDDWWADADLAPAVRWALPDWIMQQWRSDWPEEAVRMAEAACQRPPMWLRCDLDRQPRDAAMQALAAAGIGAEAPLAPDSAIRLEQPAAVDSLPGFAAGRLSVQDGAAQFAAGLLAPRPGDRVLDACAAPGGKTLHLLERQPALAELLALDQDAQRLQRVAENLQRCARQARLLAADAAATGDWWDGRRFDRILLDAPCSGSGVIRRHPDIKHLRRPDDIDRLVRQQSQLLDALWPTLAGGGMLLYATCSVFKRENQLQISDFLQRHADAVAVQPALPVGRAAGHGWQILTGEADMDGFFYCLLSKTDAGTGDACRRP